MVYDISSNHKKPYEIILIGRYSGTQSASDGKQETEEHTKQYNVKCDTGSTIVKCDTGGTIVQTKADETECGRLTGAGFSDDGGPDEHRTPRKKEGETGCIPANHVIISVPCALHSVKPPLFGK